MIKKCNTFSILNTLFRFYKPVPPKMTRKESPKNLKPIESLKPGKQKSGRSKSRSGARTPAPNKSPDEKENSKSSSHNLMDSEGMKGRKSIKSVTMNLSGQSVMGLTPSYKINYVRDFLLSIPDVVFIQDSILEDDLSNVLNEVSDSKYKYQFQVS